MQWQYIQTKDSNGYKVPCAAFAAPGSQKTVIVLPALGVRATFYERFAHALNDQGFNAVLFEHRGYGKSAVRASRHCDWGFKECVENDVAAAYQWTEQQFGPDIALLGHSLGGHMAMCYAGLNPQQLKKLILPACGSPWSGAYRGMAKFQISLLYYLIPVMNIVFGYYNGKLMGFGETEAGGVMQDWRHLAKSNTYFAAGVSTDIESSLSQFDGSVLSLRYSEDGLAPEAAVTATLSKIPKATIKKRVLSPQDIMANASQSGLKADHFSWAKFPEASVSEIADWWR